MIKRIVRLTAKDDAAIKAFQKIYAERNPFNKGIKGCREVNVMKDVDDAHVLYTVSLWDSIDDLEAYRDSDYFKTTWPMVKAQLAKRAEAFSLTPIDAQ